MSKTSKEVEGKAQYKKVLMEYAELRTNLKKLEQQHQALSTQGVNLEGQLKALKDVFEIDEKEMLNEVNDELKEKANKLKDEKKTG